MTTHNAIERFYDHLSEVLKHNFTKEVAIEGKITEHLAQYNCYIVNYENYNLCCRYIGDPEFNKGDTVRIVGKINVLSDTARIILDISIIVSVDNKTQIKDLFDHYQSVDNHLKNKITGLKFKKPLPNKITKIAFIVPESDKMVDRVYADLSSIKCEINVFKLFNNKMHNAFINILLYVHKYGFFDLIIFYTSESSFQYLLPLSTEKVLNAIMSIEKEYNRIPIITCFDAGTKSILRSLSDLDVESLIKVVQIINKINSDYEMRIMNIFNLIKSRAYERIQFYERKLIENESKVTKITGIKFDSTYKAQYLKTLMNLYINELLHKLDKVSLIVNDNIYAGYVE